MGECIDCFHYKYDEDGQYRCKLNGRNVRRNYDDSCNGFASDDSNSCFECEYAQINMGLGATKEKDYFCKKKLRRINGKNLACSDFVEA